MGIRIVQVSLGVSAVVVLVTIVASCLPFHFKQFNDVGALVFSVSTYPMTIKVSFWCAVLPGNRDWCYDLADNHDLETVSQQFCAPTVSTLFPSTCDGLKNAFGMGLAVVLCVFTNFVLNAVAGFLTYQYMMGSPKKQFRKVALILLAIGIILMISCLTAYIPLVIILLDETRTTVPGLQIALSGSRATGVSKGYILMWVAVIFQIVVLVLQRFAKSTNEARFAEAREHEKFMAEMQMYNQAAVAGARMTVPGGGGGGMAYYIGGSPGLAINQRQSMGGHWGGRPSGPPQFVQQNHGPGRGNRQMNDDDAWG